MMTKPDNQDKLNGKPRTRYAIFMIVLAAFFFAFVEAVGGFLPAGTSSYQTVWTRYAVHLLFMVVAFAPRYKGALVRTSRLKMQIFRALMMVGMPVFYIVGLSYMPYKDVESVFWLSPLMIMGLAVLLFHEQIGISRWIGSVVAFAGVALLYRPDRDLISVYVLLPLGMGACFAIYNILTHELRAERTITNLFYTAFVVFVVMTAFTPTFWQPLTLGKLWPMALIGLTGYIGLWGLDKAYEAATPGLLAPFLFTSTVFSVVLDYVLFRTLPGGSIILGIVVILGSVISLFYNETRRERAKEAILVASKHG